MSEASPEVRTTSTVVALVALELVIDNTAYTVTSSSNNLMSELENSTLVTVGSTTSLCFPKSVQSSLSLTIHSESSAFVPAEAVQSVFPDITVSFLTSVWSFVAAVTPATSQPDPGSPLKSPTKSMYV